MGAVESSVAAHQEKIGVLRMEGHGVVVHVFMGAFHRLPAPASVVGAAQPHIGMIERIETVRIAKEFLVIVRARTTAGVVTHFGPTLTPVFGTPDPTFAPGQLDRGIDDLGFLGGHGQGDLALVGSRQSSLEFLPGLAPIHRFVDTGLRPTIDEGPNRTMTLVSGRIEHIRVTRLEDHIRDPGVGPLVKYDLPGPTAVDRFVEAPFAPGGPQRTLGGDVYRVGIAGVHENAGDVFALLEPHVLEALATVEALVDAIAIPHVTPAHILTRSHPKGVGIGGIDCHAAQGIGPILFEDGFPRRAGIDRFPEVSRTGGHIPGIGVFRNDGDVGNTSRHQGRPDAAQLDPGE